MNTFANIDKLKNIQTPFYYYNTELLRNTLGVVKTETERFGYFQHYAIKANANARILKIIASYGFGADCVSGGEIKAALNAGFPSNKIVYAGVGKADWEINLGLEADIFCFNVESLAELLIINELAENKNKIANVELRINPNVDAHTHAKITTGLAENKFGINIGQIDSILEESKKLANIKVIGLHFHIGSQITQMAPFEALCKRVNELQIELEQKGYHFENLNFGGGLGIDYQNPVENSIPNFSDFFKAYSENIQKREGQNIHFELGRAIVGQCGNLISKVLYVKEGEVKNFAILDAGMTELIRPAMYDSYHQIENITSCGETAKYDVVGPICESSDVFGKDRSLNMVKRGNLIALHSAGAYGEVMSSMYNLRELPKSYFSEDLA